MSVFLLDAKEIEELKSRNQQEDCCLTSDIDGRSLAEAVERMRQFQQRNPFHGGEGKGMDPASSLMTVIPHAENDVHSRKSSSAET